MHDLDYYMQRIFNCCLINLKDMLEYGTVISETMIEPQKLLLQLVMLLHRSSHKWQVINMEDRQSPFRIWLHSYKSVEPNTEKKISLEFKDLSSEQQNHMVEYMVNSTFNGTWKWTNRRILQDPCVSEIVVQHYDNIVIEKNGKIQSVEATFNSEKHLETIIQRIVQKVQRQINQMNPIVDARLKDGSRECYDSTGQPRRCDFNDPKI